MRTEVITVGPDTPLKEVARRLAEHGVSGAPVLDDTGRVVGVISESDFLIKERGRRHVTRSLLGILFGGHQRELARVDATTAGEAMTTPPVTIDGMMASVREAAVLMAEKRVNRLPVLRNGRLVGIVTRGDILRLYTRSDDELAGATRRALRAVDGVRVDGVHDGIVALSGTVPTLAVADTIAGIIEGLDGVIRVDAAGLVAVDGMSTLPPPTGILA
jgi:CBS domain-containing protein